MGNIDRARVALSQRSRDGDRCRSAGRRDADVVGGHGRHAHLDGSADWGQYKTSNRAFYAAEAGGVEGRARLRFNAGAALIADAFPSSTQWRAYIGDAAKAQAQGYESGQAQHLRTDSLQSSLTYLVTIRHQTNDAGQVLFWGDDNGMGSTPGIPRRG